MILTDSSYSTPKEQRRRQQERENSFSVSEVSSLSAIRDTLSIFEPSTLTSPVEQDQERENGLIIAKRASLPRMPLGPRSNDLSDLTINKLNFKAIQLYGREEQLEVLRESWELLKSSCSSCPTSGSRAGHSRQFITIAGPSGTGKSRLAHVLSEWSQAEKVGMVVRGKFDSKQSQKSQTIATINEDALTSTTSMNTIFSANTTTGGCTEPYSGIARACADMLGSIMAMKHSPMATLVSQKRTDGICHKISTELGPELALLEQFIPALSEVFGEVHPEAKRPSASTVDTDLETTTTTGIISSESQRKRRTSASSTASTFSAEETSNQIIFAFHQFIRAVAQEFEPLVMVIDDLQWADDASFDLLEALLMAGNNCIPTILLLGLYRSDEVDESHFLHRRLSTIQSKARSSTYRYGTISVDNLTVQHIEQTIKDLLSFDSGYADGENGDEERQIASLAQLCKDKTLGNAFYLLQFLSSLHQKRLLTFNFGTMKWNWDEKAIKLQTNASANVIELLQAKMKDLDQGCIEILKLAACLGSMINQDCLKILWREFFHHPPEGGTEDQLFETTLNMLEEIGFLISVTEMSSRSYTWAHDKVHEAALSLIPEDIRPSFTRRAGEALLSELSEAERDTFLFTIVNLLNAGIDQNEGSRLSPIDIATLNRAATQKAVAISAFESAAEYARNGIRSLPKAKWKTAYQVAIDLYSLGAKAEGYLGRVEIMDRYCRAVLSQKVGKEEDKLRVYNVMIDSMVFRGQVDDAVAIIIDVLKRANCNFPTNSFSVYFRIIKGLMKTRAIMKRMAASKLTLMNNPTREELVELMKRLNVCFYISGDRRYPLTGFHCVSWAIKFGVCGASSVSFGQAGVVMIAAANDYRGAIKYAERAFEILSLTGEERFRPNVLMIAYIFIYTWTRPLRTCLPPLFESYNVGLRYGDTETATSSILHYVILKFMSGSTLDTLTEELAQYTRQMKALDRQMTYKLSRTFLQALLNLSGLDNEDSSTCITGDALPEEGRDEANNEPLLWAAIITFGGILQTFFGDHIAAADDMVKYGTNCVTDIFVSSPTAVLDTYLKCVSCFAAARKTGNKKYFTCAKKLRSKIKGWSKAGNPNVTHYERFVDAELMALNGKHDKAIKLYEETIKISARCGCQQDAALACERLGDLYLNVLKNEDDASFRLGQARTYWLGWGAMAKVSQLDSMYSELPGPVGALFLSSSMNVSSALLQVSKNFSPDHDDPARSLPF